MNIPNYVDMRVIGEDGHFTPEWKIIMEQLLITLNQNAGPEGLVAPSQPDTLLNPNVTTIQDNKIPSSMAPSSPTFVYTCKFGTILYNSTANTLMVALDSGGGIPKFYTVVTI